MVKFLLLFIIATLLSFTPAYAASKPAAKPTVKPSLKSADKPAANKQETGAALEQLKEFDFAQKLVNGLGFGEGLPEKPAEKDYLDILGGNRIFKFEAEKNFDTQNDPVSVRDYPLFGAFSGKGWVHGTTTRVAVHFKVFIPISGKYTLKVGAKGDNQLWSVAGKAFKLDSGNKLKESSIGEVFIPAGELEFNTVIPAAGAIDYFTFTAPSYAPVEPFAGWSPAKRLTVAAVNETVAALLGLESLLPEDTSYKTKIIAAATLPNIPETARTTDSQIYGKPVGEKWVRAFQTGATLSIPLEIEAPSVYRIRVRAIGTEISAGFGQRKIIAALQPTLDWTDLGTFRLSKGLHSLELQLPPTGGLDVIEVTKKLSAPADYAAITKSGIMGDAAIKAEALDPLIKTLQGQFKERK